jgi:hypothetical protein
MDEIAEASAVAGAARRFPLGVSAEAADEVVGIDEGAAIGQVDMVTQLIFPLLGRWTSPSARPLQIRGPTQ